MNVGLIIYGSLDTLSGGYLYDRKLVEFLRAQGDTIEIISLPWRHYAAHLTDNIHLRLPANPDILIQDELNHPSLIFANRKRHSYPVISLVHHLRCSELRPKWQNIFYGWVEQNYLRSVDGFIFNSRTTENVVNRLVGNRRPSIVAYPPTDRFGEPISEQEIIERAGSDKLRILFLGNLIYRKGLHTLLEAIRAQPFACKVDVIGSLAAESHYTRKIKEYISRHQLSSFVFLHGSLDKEPLIEKLKHAHVLVVPSSYEGFGIVYLEGMCFGLPVIGTTAGAAGEIITEGVDGFLIEPENARALTERLNLLHARRDVLLQMSLAARARYLRQPPWKKTAGRIRQFLLDQINTFST